MDPSHPAPEIEKTENGLRYSVLLAPFQPPTRIELEAKINTQIECCLDVINNGDKTLNVSVIKTPSAERGINLSLSKLEIQGHNKGTIYIKWLPNEAGCWRDVLQLTDNRRIKYDVIIATTAKNDRKGNKTRRCLKAPPLSNSSNFSISMKEPFYQNNVQKNRTNQFLMNNYETQIKQTQFKCESNLNKENIYNKNSETKINTLQVKENKITEPYNKPVKLDNISEQNVNVWNDGSILPQNWHSSNELQNIRRATYIKEDKACNNLLHDDIEETDENKDNDKNKDQFNFSILLNKFALAPVDVMTSSFKSEKRESTESILQADKYRTFNISHSQFFETSAIDDTKPRADAGLVLQPASLNNLSPIKADEHSVTNNIKSLVSSSPIQFQHISKDFNSQAKHFTVDINPSIQTPNCEYFSFEVIPKVLVEDYSKKTEDVYIEISPPKKHFHAKTLSMSVSKLSNSTISRITKNNNFYDNKNRKQLHLSMSTTKNNTKNIPAIKLNKLSLAKLRNTKWHNPSFTRNSSLTIKDEEEYFIYETCELDPFAPSTTTDPFLKNIVHYDEQWLLQQELAFTKWLNALLSSPEDLSVDIETAVADIGKIWQTCKAQKNTVLAETKEVVSARYHTNTKLNTLRKAANAMFKRDEITQVLSRTNSYIIKGTLCIRSDRNLHRDIGLQKLILSLFLNYNPLWLRIGLETIYNESISLRSNNDIIGLTRFLLTRFFSDPRLTKMAGYHKTDPSQKFVTQLNQFILRKFLFLVYFLDYAKLHKLIGYDPCLFHKRAQYKESREILLSFSRELLSGIGDITRLLRGHDYVLNYRQTHIEEYDYAVVNIRHDLRDGVRLCRTMELITGIRGLIQRCRVPAISRLQKVHNVDMALNALRQAGYVLEGNIDAKNIADGHCEKTLSLLWQIIHKYQAPRFDRAARVIQKWWRAYFRWYICVRNYLHVRKNLAAITIQRIWRRKKLPFLHIKINCNLEERKRYLCIRTATIRLQRWWRQVRGNAKKLQEVRKKYTAIITLQRKWRATLMMRRQRNRYCELRNAALIIQSRLRATRIMKLQHSKYLSYKNAAINIQIWYRSVKVMREQRELFVHSKKNARIIQTWWRKHLLVRKARAEFLLKKAAARSIERWWICVTDRKKYLLYRKSAILIQKTWRTYQAYKREVACLKIQTWWRAATCSRKYGLRKSCCLKLQHWWRSVQVARVQRLEYLRLREAACVIQKNWRMKMFMRNYVKQRRAILLIQSWYRRANSTKVIRQRYLKIRCAVIRIQNWWRNVTVARQEQKRYLQLRESALFLQTYWRRCILARTVRQRYLTKRKACVTLQSWWRMIRTKNEYKRYRTCLLKMQRRWRAKKIACAAKREYLLTRAAIVVQTRWRTLKARKRFIALRQAAVVIQSYYRMKIAFVKYETVKYATLIIQTYWRAYVVGKKQRLRYLLLRQAAIILQRRYRQKIMEREEQYWQQNETDLTDTYMRDECEASLMDPNVTAKKLSFQGNDFWQEKINLLRSCNSVGMLHYYLNNLGTIMMLNPIACTILCELNVADDIYSTIAQNNRSLPWMKVCLRSCSILITLTKYPVTRKYVLKKKYALVLVKLLSGSLKNKKIFLYCATLIWLLSQDEDYLKAIIICPKINWLIKSIQRKVLKDTEVAKLETYKDWEKLYPSREPDHTVTKKSRLFTDMSHAIVAIAKRLSM
ncbi:hypothetical protein PUN28_009034 [Cardiocondyla obscurior]|uniref:Calponin-homology (CH) domain-containing protein n=1 Tax=Cardiocondyla obscurior TaxID=286306 RepID=A0AAW2FQL1_9HYME